jgi:SAM-dependent methyltransferase
MTDTATDRWREALSGWAIPEHIAAKAPVDPHGFSVERFSERADEALRRDPTPTHETARAALPAGGAVLDVGCGGGAASLPLAEHAGHLIGVDEDGHMLEAFAARAAQLGVAVETVEGSWPAVADDTPSGDVVVCAHVVFNVADLASFVQALTSHARRRVVLELPVRHPLAWTAAYWRDVHGITRPGGPTADDALEIIAELGLDVHERRWRQPHRGATSGVDGLVTFLRQRLCVDGTRDGELRQLIDRHGVPIDREVVTAWWDTTH